jgi:hypothetical protein
VIVYPPDEIDVDVVVVPVVVVVPPFAAAAARLGSLLTVLVITIGVYPGAVTVPPETIETDYAGVSEAVEVSEETATV